MASFLSRLICNNTRSTASLVSAATLGNGKSRKVVILRPRHHPGYLQVSGHGLGRVSG